MPGRHRPFNDAAAQQYAAPGRHSCRENFLSRGLPAAPRCLSAGVKVSDELADRHVPASELGGGAGRARDRQAEVGAYRFGRRVGLRLERRSGAGAVAEHRLQTAVTQQGRHDQILHGPGQTGFGESLNDESLDALPIGADFSMSTHIFIFRDGAGWQSVEPISGLT